MEIEEEEVVNVRIKVVMATDGRIGNDRGGVQANEGREIGQKRLRLERGQKRVREERGEGRRENRQSGRRQTNVGGFVLGKNDTHEKKRSARVCRWR